MPEAIFSVECDEPEGKIMRHVYPMLLTETNIMKFWNAAKAFPSLYGKQILGDPQSFIDMFMQRSLNGDVSLNGLLWVVDDFVGVFYLSDIENDRHRLVDAQVHYTFFDKRHKGRRNLVRKMIEYGFERYKFQRLSAQIPNYNKDHTRHFILDLGFHYEGKKSKYAFYRDEWFDVNLYGILAKEV